MMTQNSVGSGMVISFCFLKYNFYGQNEMVDR